MIDEQRAESEEVYARIVAYFEHFEPVWLVFPEVAALVNAVPNAKFKSLVKKAVICELNGTHQLVYAEVLRENLTTGYRKDTVIRRNGFGTKYDEHGTKYARKPRVQFLPWDRRFSTLMDEIREMHDPAEVQLWEAYPEKFMGWWGRPPIEPLVALGRFW